MFTVETVENLVWVNEAKTQFNCLVKYAEFAEKHPSTIDPSDMYAHIVEIWDRANRGDFGVIAEYTPPATPVATEPQPTVQGAQSL